MQRRIQIQADSRRSSRRGSPHSSRPSSAPASRSSSRAGARIQDDDDDNDEYTSNAFLSPSLTASGAPDSLTESLDKLLLTSSDSEDEESKEHTHKDKFSEGIEMLTLDRRSTSLEAREKALIDILSIISQKYEPEKITPSLCELLTKSFTSSRSELESLLSIQAIVVAAAVDIDLFFESLNEEVLPKLLHEIKSDEGTTKYSPTCRANLAIGYSLLQYIIHEGSGGFKVDEILESLVDLAAECNNSDETQISSAAILGAGLLITTLPNPNVVIDEYMPVFIDYINNPSHTVKLAAAKVVALFYQIYNYEEGTENGELNEQGILQRIPYIDHHELEFQLKEQINESSKRIGKKDKRERKSLFRDVLSTVEQFQSVDSRDALKSEDLLITHLKLSRSKSLSIDSWEKLLLIQHYKWAYGPSIHTQIANNPLVKSTVQDSTYHGVASAYSFTDSSAVPSEDTPTSLASQIRAKSDLKAQQDKAALDRQRQINSERWEKQLNQGTVSTS